ncbi:hypothetical protein QBC44DRAFT_368455 [Cladorrhinum sp. PSN332]|nr:hypothetical protein QBC44DRAFT_368455 [Cladorrhinum sp. PSN332]
MQNFQLIIAFFARSLALAHVGNYQNATQIVTSNGTIAGNLNATIQDSAQNCDRAPINYKAFANSTSPYLIDCQHMFVGLTDITVQRDPADRIDYSISSRSCWLNLHLGMGEWMTVNRNQLLGIWQYTLEAAKSFDESGFQRAESFGDSICGRAVVNWEIKRNFAFTKNTFEN